MNYSYRLAALISLLPLAAAAWFSIHLAAADAWFQRHTPDSVARAIAIEPRNTDYLALRALQLDYDGADSTPLLERAAQLNPLSSSPRIRLGLAAEIRGDFDSAEKWLLDAARVDRQFEPRWTLANFYFRRASEEGREPTVAGDRSADRFWKWMRQALQVSYGDRRPAFDLCWRMGDAPSMEATTILDRAIPDRREVLAAYLQYTLDAHPDAAGPVALKLAASGEPSDRPLLLVACDRLISPRHDEGNDAGNDAASDTGNDAALALRLWSAIGYAAPAGIFNGSFTAPPLNHGFDWRLIESPGVVHTALDQPRPARRIALDGRQPESCKLLTQILNLAPHARYTLRWEARTSGLSAPAGIEWRIGDQRAAVPPGDAPAFGSAAFIATSELMPLTLFYQRPMGQARAEGFIELSRVSIEKGSEKTP